MAIYHVLDLGKHISALNGSATTIAEPLLLFYAFCGKEYVLSNSKGGWSMDDLDRKIISAIEFREKELKQLSGSIKDDARAMQMSRDILEVAGADYQIRQSMAEKQELVDLLRRQIKVLRATIPWYRRIWIGLVWILHLF
ncbi:MAG: hypothetical protein WCG48_04110 [Candidatus Berkelbacteria bacterium]